MQLPVVSMDPMDPGSIAAVSFDVGGTLLHPWPSVGEVYARAALRAGVGDFPAEALEVGFRRAWSARSGFDYSTGSWRRLVQEAFAGLCAPGECDRFFNDVYHQFARAESWRLTPGTTQTLEALRAAGYRLAITSNWDERLVPLLNDLRLDGFFEVITVSREFGVHKPDREIFLHTCSQLGLSPKQVLHVGDSRTEDLQGALDAGLQALLLAPGAQGSGADLQDLSSLQHLLRCQPAASHDMLPP